jgi:hypothetical protein
MAEGGPRRDIVQEVFAERGAAHYQRFQREVRRGGRRSRDKTSRGVPAEGGTRFSKGPVGLAGRVGRLLRPFG